VAETADLTVRNSNRRRDDEPSFGLCRNPKAAYGRLLDEVLADREEIRLMASADRRHLRSSSRSNSAPTFWKSCRGVFRPTTDARLSFDVEGSIAKARRLIKLYEEKKIPRDAC